MRLLLLALVPLASGCASSAIDARAASAVDDAHRSAEAHVVYASCADHAPLGPGCGLILKHVTSDAFRTRFRDLKCQGLGDDGCQALFQSSVDAWLNERYYLADFGTVEAECRRHPGKCNDPVAHEEIMLDLHNMRVRADLGRAEHDIEEERRVRQALHADAQLRAIDAGLQMTDLVRR